MGEFTTDREALCQRLGARPLVLVGMMGAGKTTVGRRLAALIGRPFVDSDEEVEAAAGMSIEDLFATRGEAEFRAGEAKVIARLLQRGALVLGTGGGAFIDPHTRALIKAAAVSVWLDADIDVLFARVRRRPNRPLLKTADPRATLQGLVEKRNPIYAEADLTVTSHEVSAEVVAESVIAALLDYFGTPHVA